MVYQLKSDRIGELMDIELKSMSMDTYKKLIEYAIKKCNIVSFVRVYDQNYEENENIKSIILKNKDFKIDYSYEDIDDIFKSYVNNIEMKKYALSKSLKSGPFIHWPIDAAHINSLLFIKYTLERMYYDRVVEEFLKKYSRKKISEKDISLSEKSLKRKHISEHKIPLIYRTEYKFQLDNSMFSDLIYMKESITDWDYPKSLMDICFYIDDECWLYSIAHEKICWINCETKEEYNYLKSIGIEFKDEFSNGME